MNWINEDGTRCDPQPTPEQLDTMRSTIELLKECASDVVKLGLKSHRETMSEIFGRSPAEALEETFNRYKKLNPFDSDHCFISTACYGPDLSTSYSRFSRVTKKDLEGRMYIIEFWDGKVTLFFIDVIHNLSTCGRDPVDKFLLDNPELALKYSAAVQRIIGRSW